MGRTKYKKSFKIILMELHEQGQSIISLLLEYNCNILHKWG